VAGLDVALGSDPADIPLIMITLSALAGAVVPALALIAFRAELSYHERRLLGFVLFVHPNLWMSSQYGNTATPALAFVVAAVTILSNHAGRRAVLSALALFGMGTLIRADAVLLMPLVLTMLYLKHRSLRRLTLQAGGFGGVMLGVYALLLRFDPRMDDMVSTTSKHLFNAQFPTMFWEYLIWAVSPIPLLFAVWGFRDLITNRRGRLLLYMTAWGLPVSAFYFSSTTTPRYFLLTAFPISLCTAVGLVEFADQLRRLARPRLVWAGLLSLSSLHMFIGLGQFTPDRFANVFRRAQIMTHDGLMYTGAFLPKALFQHGFLKKTLRSPGFGKIFDLPAAFDAHFGELAATDGPTRTVIVLLGGTSMTMFHYHAQVAGAEYTSLGEGTYFAIPYRVRLGNTEFMTVGYRTNRHVTVDEFTIEAGDEVWVRGKDMEKTMREQFPPDLDVIQIDSPLPEIQAYRCIPREEVSGAW
jgi:hypothetical protein